MALEIVDFPLKMVIFQFAILTNNQRVNANHRDSADEDMKEIFGCFEENGESNITTPITMTI